MKSLDQDRLVASFREAVNDFQKGDLKTARKKLSGIQKKQPGIPDVLHLLGIVEFQLRNIDKAILYLKGASEGTNHRPSIVNALGVAYLEKGRTASAISAFVKAVSQAPDNAEYLFNLANAHKAEENHKKAIGVYMAGLDRVAAGSPLQADLLFNLGLCLKTEGDQRKALECFIKVLEIQPDQADALLEAGALHLKLRNLEAAHRLLLQATEQDPSSWNAQNELGITLLEMGDIGQSIQFLHRALELESERHVVEGNLGRAYHQGGRAKEAVRYFKAAMEISRDNPTLHSNLIYSMNCCPEFSAQDILAEAKNWNRQHAAKNPMPRPMVVKNKNPLKIGYVSADFYQHPVGSFVENVIREHDRARFEVFCYSNGVARDALTETIQNLSDHWRDISSLQDHEAFDVVFGDGIDVLVDLSGHTAGNRLPLFSRRPAPVQLTGIGAFCTSGVHEIDFFIGDRYQIPDGAENDHSENVLIMPDDCICYGPPDYLPPVTEAPVLATGIITFGSFNNLSKVSPETIALWSGAMNAVPNSRILIKTHALNCSETRDYFRQLFAENGIEGERLLFEGGAPHRELLSSYGKMDIALDTYPYSGGLTTIEALIMGVPVLTLAGNSFSARHSESHLANSGFKGWIAEDTSGFAGLAKDLAENIDELSVCRKQVREQVLASPICDGRRYTRHLEEMYRQAYDSFAN